MIPEMTAAFFRHIRAAFKKILTIRGRSTRAEFWCIFALNEAYCLLCAFLPSPQDTLPNESLYYLNAEGSASVITQGIGFGISVILMLTLLSATVRRLRDAGFSPLWLLPYLLLLIGKYVIPPTADISCVLPGDGDSPTSILVGISVYAALLTLAHLAVLVLCLFKSRPESTSTAPAQP